MSLIFNKIPQGEENLLEEFLNLKIQIHEILLYQEGDFLFLSQDRLGNSYLDISMGYHNELACRGIFPIESDKISYLRTYIYQYISFIDICEWYYYIVLQRNEGHVSCAYKLKTHSKY